MKIRFLNLITILLFFIFCQALLAQTLNKFHNRIDDIRTADEIETLLTSIDKKYEEFKVNTNMKFDQSPCQQLAEKLKITSWTKTDFDNNGYTDLLVMGTYYQPAVIVVMDMGGNKFSVKQLTRESFVSCSLAAVEKSGKENIVHYYGSSDATVPQNLIYKFGNFVEVNNSPPNYKIQKIKYETSLCYGTCPVFDLTINATRDAVYNAEKFNKQTGTFKGIINKQNYDELTGLLNYTDFPNLKNDYAVHWTDDQTSFLTITYNGGKVKKIRDYGLIGTFGLSGIYRILFDLRENQTWK